MGRLPLRATKHLPPQLSQNESDDPNDRYGPQGETEKTFYSFLTYFAQTR